jgi:hypothetical protein
MFRKSCFSAFDTTETMLNDIPILLIYTHKYEMKIANI